MTRKRKTDTDLVVSAAGATAPARRTGGTRARGQRAAEPVAPIVPVTPEPEALAPVLESVVIVETPSYEAVAQLAYSYWEARGCQGGSPEEDWIRAEQELRMNAHAATA